MAEGGVGPQAWADVDASGILSGAYNKIQALGGGVTGVTGTLGNGALSAIAAGYKNTILTQGGSAGNADADSCMIGSGSSNLITSVGNVGGTYTTGSFIGSGTFNSIGAYGGSASDDTNNTYSSIVGGESNYIAATGGSGTSASAASAYQSFIGGGVQNSIQCLGGICQCLSRFKCSKCRGWWK